MTVLDHLRRTWCVRPSLVAFTLLMAVLAVFFAVGIAADDRVIAGQRAWLKPTKFALSISIYTATIAWLLTLVRAQSPRAKRLLEVIAWTVLIALAIEIAVITTQVVRGTTSHFNVSTPLDMALWNTMGIAIIATWAVGLLLAVFLFAQPLEPPAVAWSIRLGLSIALVGMAQGFLMTFPTPEQLEILQAGERITIVGAGPGGMEAARVAAERGHAVTVFEAADQPGGQIRLTAQDERRREMISIIAWRKAMCDKHGVQFRFNTFAEMEDVLATEPDEVVIATGGLPHTEVLEQGNHLVCSAWDILSGDVKPGRNVLIFDDAGDHAALQAADLISATGAAVEIVTPDRSFSPEVMAMNLVPYMRNLQKRDTTFTVTWRLMSVAREGNQLRARLGSDYGDFTRERIVDQVVVNHGTRPLDDLYFELKPLSSNLGEVDYEALTTGGLQEVRKNPEGRFRLYRIGDAVAARNTHAAIYDALRLVKDL